MKGEYHRGHIIGFIVCSLGYTRLELITTPIQAQGGSKQLPRQLFHHVVIESRCAYVGPAILLLVIMGCTYLVFTSINECKYGLWKSVFRRCIV